MHKHGHTFFFVFFHDNLCLPAGGSVGSMGSTGSLTSGRSSTSGQSSNANAHLTNSPVPVPTTPTHSPGVNTLGLNVPGLHAQAEGVKVRRTQSPKMHTRTDVSVFLFISHITDHVCVCVCAFVCVLAVGHGAVPVSQSKRTSYGPISVFRS